jgi:hypothetical protein
MTPPSPPTYDDLVFEIAALKKELSYTKMVADRHDRAIDLCKQLMQSRVTVCERLSKYNLRLDADDTIVPL